MKRKNEMIKKNKYAVLCFGLLLLAVVFLCFIPETGTKKIPAADLINNDCEIA